jgi:hypothetical protein
MANVPSTMLNNSDSTGVNDWVKGASRWSILQEEYRSAAAVTNESIYQKALTPS